MGDKKRLEQIVGVIGFLDACLGDIKAEQEEQFEGLFRVSPAEDDYREFAKRVLYNDTHETIKAALENEDPSISIVCSSKLLKSLANSLEFPLIPMNFALEPFDAGTETDKSIIGALLAESFLQSVAKTHAGEDAAAWAATGAQLFALLCHASRRPVTKMNEYALCVCFLPSLTGSRVTKVEDLMVEQQQIMAFQTNRRTGTAPTRIEAFISYGRRIWGAIYDCLPTLQNDLAEMSKVHKQQQPMGNRKRDMVFRFIERAAHPLANAPRLREMRRPSLITRAFSVADRRQSSQLAAAPPTSRLDATFVGPDASPAVELAKPGPTPTKAVPPPPPPRTDKTASPMPPGLPLRRKSSSGIASDSERSFYPRIPMRRSSGSGLPTEQLTRSSSSGIQAEQSFSATVKAVAQTSAIKRRLSKDVVVPCGESFGEREGSTGKQRTASGFDDQNVMLENSRHSGSFRRAGSGRSSNPIDITNLGQQELAMPGAYKKERQPSLGDVGRQLFHSVNRDSERTVTSPPHRFEEHDSDLL